MNNKNSYWVKLSETHDLKTFSNYKIKIVGVINTTVKCNDCPANDVKATVAEDGHRPLIGLGLIPQRTIFKSIKTNIKC